MEFQLRAKIVQKCNHIFQRGWGGGGLGKKSHQWGMVHGYFLKVWNSTTADIKVS